MAIGENIKHFRKQAGLTQKELAKKIGCAEITIRQYETGKREPRQDQQFLICEALGIPPIALITGELDERNNHSFLSGAYDLLDALEETGGNIEEAKEIAMLKIKLEHNFLLLNSLGKNKAVEQIELLTRIPEYQKTEI